MSAASSAIPAPPTSFKKPCASEKTGVLNEEKLWPLPLTAYEQYMWTDDRPSHPMVFCIEVLLEGTLERPALESALKRALVRHPLLRAQIQKRFARQPAWVAADKTPELQWLTPIEYKNASRPPFLNLRNEPGLRMWAVDDKREPRFVFQFHHAAVDGVGAIEFIGDLLALYAQQTSAEDDEVPELEPIDFEKLHLRGKLGFQSRSRGDWIPGFARYTWENISQFPAALAGSKQNDEPSTRGIPPYVTRILDNTVLQAVKNEAARRGVTPNEIYTAIMLQTFARWNETQRAGRKPGLLRLCMPISLRSPELDDCPSANIISYMLINCPRRVFDDFNETLRHVHRMSLDIIGTPNGPTFVRNLAFLRKVPGAIPFMTNAPLCFGTGILANVGDVRRQFRSRFPLVRGRVKAGNLVMAGLLGAAPVRRRSGVATSVGTYGRRLFINMNFDRHLLSRSDAERLIDLFVSGLMERVSGEKIVPGSNFSSPK